MTEKLNGVIRRKVADSSSIPVAEDVYYVNVGALRYMIDAADGETKLKMILYATENFHQIVVDEKKASGLYTDFIRHLVNGYSSAKSCSKDTNADDGISSDIPVKLARAIKSVRDTYIKLETRLDLYKHLIKQIDDEDTIWEILSSVIMKDTYIFVHDYTNWFDALLSLAPEKYKDEMLAELIHGAYLPYVRRYGKSVENYFDILSMFTNEETKQKVLTYITQGIDWSEVNDKTTLLSRLLRSINDENARMEAAKIVISKMRCKAGEQAGLVQILLDAVPDKTEISKAIFKRIEKWTHKRIKNPLAYQQYE